MTAPSAVELPATGDLRLATLGTAAWAELSLHAAGLLSAVALAGAWLLLAVAGLAASALRSGSGPRWRRGVATSVMLIAFLSCLNGGGPATDNDLAGRLGLVVVLAIPANALVQDSLRDLYVGLSLTCATLVLAAGLATGSAVALPLVVGVSLVVACLGLLGAARIRGGHRPPPGAGLRTAGMLATSSVAVVVVGLLAFLLVPHPSGLHSKGRLANAVRGVSNLPSALQGASAPAPRTTSGYIGRLDLRMRGELPSDPVASVPAAAPELWRAQVFTTYDGASWYPAPADLSLLPASTAHTYVVPREPGSPGPPTRTDTVLLAPTLPTALVLSPGQPTSITTSGQPARSSQGSYWFVRRGQGEDYQVASIGYDALHPRAGTKAGRDPADLTDAAWTRLPGTVPARVLELGRSLAAGAKDRSEAVARVEAYLRTHDSYRLDAPVPALGQDAVDAFLFGSHQGFCEQFASAEAVLLRAAGIPARVATGYAYGRPGSAGRRLFIASDAHAWVEVYSPGVGWTSSDPTAGAPLSVDHPGPLHRLASALRRALSTSAGRALLALLLVSAVGLAMLVARFTIRALSQASRGRPTPQPDRLLGALGRLEAALARDGRARAPGETLIELGRRLALEDAGSTHAVEALQVLGRASYAPSPPCAPDRVRAAAALETYAARVEELAGQKNRGHQGARASSRAREVALTAPSVRSRTLPASASTDNDVPPR
jgi:transglutaminase-like putative cysteine protease